MPFPMEVVTELMGDASMYNFIFTFFLILKHIVLSILKIKI